MLGRYQTIVSTQKDATSAALGELQKYQSQERKNMMSKELKDSPTVTQCKIF